MHLNVSNFSNLKTETISPDVNNVNNSVNNDVNLSTGSPVMSFSHNIVNNDVSVLFNVNDNKSNCNASSNHSNNHQIPSQSQPDANQIGSRNSDSHSMNISAVSTISDNKPIANKSHNTLVFYNSKLDVGKSSVITSEDISSNTSTQKPKTRSKKSSF